MDEAVVEPLAPIETALVPVVLDADELLDAAAQEDETVPLTDDEAAKGPTTGMA